MSSAVGSAYAFLNSKDSVLRNSISSRFNKQNGLALKPKCGV